MTKYHIAHNGSAITNPIGMLARYKNGKDLVIGGSYKAAIREFETSLSYGFVPFTPGHNQGPEDYDCWPRIDTMLWLAYSFMRDDQSGDSDQVILEMDDFISDEERANRFQSRDNTLWINAIKVILTTIRSSGTTLKWHWSLRQAL